MEKKEIKVGDRIIPVEAGKVIPMTKEEWKKFQKQMKVERDYFYMIGNKKYIHYEDEDYVRVSDIQQELDKAREDVLIELQKEFSEFGVPDDVRYTQPLFYINEVIEKKLSKLKTKEDGK